MKKVLVTGATGNIGKEVIHSLSGSAVHIIAAVRDTEKAAITFNNKNQIDLRTFDFEKPHTYDKAFHGVDILFLLRPPQISEVEKYFRPLLNAAKSRGITKIIFLSVQGAEKSKVIPHNKIEGLIRALDFNFIFVRPSYFMQNLTTTLLPEIVNNHSITLPSGNARFNWIDVKNIGEASAMLILHFEKYQNASYTLTGKENKSFPEVTKLMSEITGVMVKFISVNPLVFFFKKVKEGISRQFALVMTILHFLPRVQKEPDISDDYTALTGKRPTTLEEFIRVNRNKLVPKKSV